MGPPLPSTNILWLLTKYEINETSKIPTSKLFSDSGKISKCNLGFHSKKLVFNLFHELGKIVKLARTTFKKPKIFLLTGNNLEVKPKTNTQNIPI